MLLSASGSYISVAHIFGFAFTFTESQSKYNMVKSIYAQNKNMFERESMGLQVSFSLLQCLFL